MSGSQYTVISAVTIAVLGVSPILPAVTTAEPLYDLPRLTPRPVSVAGIDGGQVSLNGMWRFNPSPPEEFWKADAVVGNGWAEIQVPGQWIMQGFMVEEDTAAGYWREFILPSDWKGHRVKLRCDAVYSDAFVDGGFIKILVAEYSNGGGGPFLKGHLDAGRRPLERGSVLKGTVRLELTAPGTRIEGSEKFM